MLQTRYTAHRAPTNTQCSTYRAHRSFVAVATALKRAIIMMICRMLFCIRAG